jgi:hypothetical protein
MTSGIALKINGTGSIAWGLSIVGAYPTLGLICSLEHIPILADLKFDYCADRYFMTGGNKLEAKEMGNFGAQGPGIAGFDPTLGADPIFSVPGRRQEDPNLAPQAASQVPLAPFLFLCALKVISFGLSAVAFLLAA